MSSNAGFVARELDRRRFQEAVAITLDKHAEAINDLRDQVRVTREFMADLSVRLDALQQMVGQVEATHVFADVAAALAVRVAELEAMHGDEPIRSAAASGMLHDDGTGQ